MADRRKLQARFFVTEAGVAYKKVWPLPMHMKHKIFERDGRNCRYCGHALGWIRARLTPEERLGVFDHIVPRCRGGRNTPENIALCCAPCNDSKGVLLLSEWTKRPAKVLA